ncbi:MAG: hypothetical protein Q8L87_03370, partial [Anaerolineales bacterium]|nr:hypothetical protein [Anaerolineales bacterium]
RERFLSQTLKVFAAKQNHNLQKSSHKTAFSLLRETFRVFAYELRNSRLVTFVFNWFLQWT